MFLSNDGRQVEVRSSNVGAVPVEMSTDWSVSNDPGLPRRLKSGKEAMRLLDVGERVGTRVSIMPSMEHQSTS